MRKRYSVIALLIIIAFIASCKMPTPENEPPFTVPYLMRGNWENSNGTASLTATENNIVLSYDYVPGADMNLEQLITDTKGMYTVSTTNTMLTVYSESMDITLYQFIVNGDKLTCVISSSERLILDRIKQN